MGIATWRWGITTVPLESPAKLDAFLEFPLSVSYTRRRNSYCEVTLEVNDQDDARLLNAAGYKKGVVGIRNGVTRFNGIITESRETSEGYVIGARDPYYTFSWRRIFEEIGAVEGEVLYTGPPVGLADAMIIVENRRKNTFLRPNVDEDGVEIDASGTVKTLKCQFGDIEAEKIESITTRGESESFNFTINALDLGYEGESGGVGSAPDFFLSQFTSTRDFVSLKSEAIFAHGPGTLNNCLDFERTLRPLVTHAIVPGGGNTFGDAFLESAVAKYGLWEDQRGHLTTEDPASLEQIASYYAETEPTYDLDLTPGPDAPQLFDDFDVVDSVPVVIRGKGRTLVSHREVREVTIELDPDSGHEVLTQVVLKDKHDFEE